ncbi:MAG: hypothetical protein B6241_04765 [Spirochaetaceae bacterium 4572_59]|nr:MAG: hypothetical protein B6241_04765 [Spirochaetaceae bacterium 4572_59]
MKHGLILFFLSIVLIFPLMAEDILLVDIMGKVEIKQPGQGWTPASEGLSLSLKTQISTGFNSKAVLDMGNSRTTIQPLSRLRIEDVKAGGKEPRTSLFLGAGSIHAEVKKSDSRMINFSISTPVATAAVRGTVFDVSTQFLKVDDGVVLFESGGYYMYVKKGGFSAVRDGLMGNPVSDPYDNAMSKRVVSADFSKYTGNRRTRGASGDGTGQPIIRIR